MALVLSPVAGIAHAQSTLEEVIVTARRREENIQKVPVAITALSDTVIKQRAVTSVFDLTKLAPGLQVDTATFNGAPRYSMRGQGLSYGAGGPAVVTYFADVPNIPPQFFDLQNLQVLKGPQGTLFGKGTSAGAILTVPRAPSSEFGGYIFSQIGNHSAWMLEGAVNVPIAGDKAALRVAGQAVERKGYTRNLFDNGRLDNQDHQAARATLTLNPTDEFHNTLIYTYTRAHEIPSSVLWASIPGVLVNNAVPGVFFDTFHRPYLDSTLRAQYGARVVANDSIDNPHPLTSHTVVNTTVWDLNDALTVKNIASWRRDNGVVGNGWNTSWASIGNDTDGTAVPSLNLIPPKHIQRQKQITEELQLQGRSFDNAVQWVAGGYLEQISTPYQVSNRNSQFITPAYAFGVFPPTVLLTEMRRDYIASHALFGSATWHATDKLNLTAGVRHTWDTRKATQSAPVPADGVTLLSAVTGRQAFVEQPTFDKRLNPVFGQKVKFKAWTYTLSADYSITDDTLVYATVRRGYRAGGFNISPPTPAFAQYTPEFVQDYEIGLKSDFDIGGLKSRINIDGYWDDYKDIQRTTLLNVNNVVSTVTTNAAKARIRGVDVEYSAVLTPWLDVSGYYSYIDAKYKAWSAILVATDPGPTDLTANPLSGTPKNKYGITPRVHFDLGNDRGEFAFQASVSHVDKMVQSDQSQVSAPPGGGAPGQPTGPRNHLGLVTMPGHTLLDLRLEWNRINGSRLSFAANVQNATNKRYLLNLNDLTTFSGIVVGRYGLPRLYTAELRYAFGGE